MTTAKIIILCGQAYLVCGLMISAWFLVFGQRRLGSATAAGSFGFRLLTVPGTTLLWPLVLLRFRGAKREGRA